MPKVSVIIPSYNHERFIKEAIESVLSQTYQDFEIIVVDDGSRDATVEIINNFEDKRIRLYVFEENKGAVFATNYAIDKSKGKYISLLNSDDAYFPQKLQRQVKYLEEHKTVSAVFAFAQAIDNNSEEVQPNPEYFEPRELNKEPKEWLKAFYYKGNWIIHPTMMIRKEVFNTFGAYDERLAQVPDFLQWVKLAFQKCKFHILQEKLVRYRFHEDNASSSKKEGVPDRLVHEYQFIIEQYLDNINDVGLLNHIFPDISKNIHYSKNKDVIKFLTALAVFSTSIEGDEISTLRKFYALQRLLNIFEDKSMAKTIKKECHFYYPELIRLSGKYHLFISERDKEKFQELQEIEKSLTWRILTKIRQKLFDKLLPNRKTLRDTIKKRIGEFPKRKVIKRTIQTNNYTKLLTIIHNPRFKKEVAKYKAELSEKVVLKESEILEFDIDSKYYFHSSDTPDLENAAIEKNIFILEKYSYDAIFYFNTEISIEDKGEQDLQKIVSAIQNSETYAIYIRKDKFGKQLDNLTNSKKTSFIPLLLLGHVIKNGLRIKLIDQINQSEIILDYDKSDPLHIGKYEITEKEHAAFNLANKQEYYVDRIENAHASKEAKNKILFALPFILDAGENHLVRKIVKNFSDKTFKSTIITTLDVEPDYLGFGDGNPKYKKLTNDIHHLYRLFRKEYWEEYIYYLIETRQIDVIYIISCSFIYKLLPRLKKKFPNIRIIDELFNEVGHLNNNRKYSKQIDLTIVENNNLYNLISRKYREKKDKLELIESGIDTGNLFNPNKYKKFTNQKAFNLSNKDLNVLFLGRLSEEKSPLKFVKIANHFKKKDKIRFLIAGDGEQRSEVVREIGTLGIQNKVKLLGMVDSPQILSAVDLLILPSDYDGRPLAVLEALSMGIPVIASNVGGLPDIIQNGENGYLLAPKDINGFVQRIKDLYSNRELLAHLSRSARENALTNFSEERMYSEYTKAIENILRAK
ncbi:glycosyltransferase [Candidatus Dojkabacteria bacterium]|nr:glycosyltransferase [Candidatus Dojkabacteria bacterium]